MWPFLEIIFLHNQIVSPGRNREVFPAPTVLSLQGTLGTISGSGRWSFATPSLVVGLITRWDPRPRDSRSHFHSQGSSCTDLGAARPQGKGRCRADSYTRHFPVH